MRIAIITRGFAQSVNDLAIPSLIETLRSMAKHVEIDVYALSYPKGVGTYYFHGLRVLALGAKPGRLGDWMVTGRAQRKLTAEHQIKPYDLVHAIWADASASIAARAARQLDLPMVLSFFAGEATWVPAIGYGGMRDGHIPKGLPESVAASDAVTCGSETLAGDLTRHFGVEPHVLPLGSDTDRFSPDGPAEPLEGDIRLLSCGSITPIKGLDLMARALHGLATDQPDLAKHLHWHVIGPDVTDPTERRQLDDMARGVTVTHHQGRPFWELPNLYRGADLSVLSSHFESQCVAAQESSACGTPVAGFGVGLLPSMASADWHVPPSDPRDLQTLLASLLSRQAEWTKEAEKQRNWVHRHVALPVSAGGFLALYERLRSR